MLHIRPVLEKDASEKVKATYEDIKKTFGIHFVPLLFQYIAGYEDYFVYSWDKIKTNLQSEYYHKSVKDLMHLARKSMHTIYHESAAMHTFISHMPPAEKQTIQTTVDQLELLNATLLVLTIGLREGVKGVVIGQQVLPQQGGEYGEDIFDQFINEKIMHENIKTQEKNVAPANRMLAPLFGNSSIVVSHYPAFFAHIAAEMDMLTRTENYLRERVIMEQQALFKALNLQYPLGCSYAEIAQFAGKKPYFSELLYVLSETFPTTFPRLVFTSSLMQQVLQEKPQGLVKI